MRRNLAVALTAATLIAGTVTAPAAFAGTTAAQAYTCTYRESSGNWYAGHYNGSTVIPSSTGVSSSGIEAQCLLKKAGFSPGTIDGVFGSKSKAAAKDFQTYINDWANRPMLVVDGIVGPDTWYFLRCCGPGM
ncbi:peptidoglycan-binding domain-containing protein [Streptomyces zingiberis]|uniref:Peptidoglycan-binding protein n=1 Tax=Streptomyces zingiberis TaxID=2053010 RepID=A0ABX1C016_9ACTN|nr:peptidoglycan-binding domain-containing protein [Streptomyces zingiberis]NJQ02045.1 peptidoglycan-binding protein [Streptomyces zingiberis]